MITKDDMVVLGLLNAKTPQERLNNLQNLIRREKNRPQVLEQYANNHIHTSYSFSPYSPAAAVWFARREGLPTAGIMDHDSISGAEEFRKAAEIAGIGATCGFEMRVSLEGTGLEDKKTNNPDQKGVAYMAFHSVKPQHWDAADKRLIPLRKARNERNKAMLLKIKKRMGIALDFERDVMPLSRFDEGGSITERHLLYALAGKMAPEAGFFEGYELLNKLKSTLIQDIYIPARDELMSIQDAVSFAEEIDCILCYPYLGDVTNSPTGDKKAAAFEDSYLDELFDILEGLGIRAVSFMPSRNTTEQLDRLMSLCEKKGFKQISGEDINQPRQSFICKQLEEPKFHHLVDAAWMMVNREKDERND